MGRTGAAEGAGAVTDAGVDGCAGEAELFGGRDVTGGRAAGVDGVTGPAGEADLEMVRATGGTEAPGAGAGAGDGAGAGAGAGAGDGEAGEVDEIDGADGVDGVDGVEVAAGEAERVTVPATGVAGVSGLADFSRGPDRVGVTGPAGATEPALCTGAAGPAGAVAGACRVDGLVRGAGPDGAAGAVWAAGATGGVTGGVAAVVFQSAPGARRERRTGGRRCTGVPGARPGVPGPPGDAGPGTFWGRPAAEGCGAAVSGASVGRASLFGVRAGVADRWIAAVSGPAWPSARAAPAGASRRGGCTGRAETSGGRRTGAGRTGPGSVVLPDDGCADPAAPASGGDAGATRASVPRSARPARCTTGGAGWDAPEDAPVSPAPRAAPPPRTGVAGASPRTG
ncbi:hypothetical protein [Streptomyces sp. NPDC056399]|uniref:hypothetical protein n=1 Tax=Streptomyces sp. NPDC056399 TaxID=3345807 RepID=UPI0035DD6DA0